MDNLRKLRVIALWMAILCLASANSFANWTTIVSGNQRLNEVNFLPNGIGYAVGDFGTMLRTTNYGVNWKSVPNTLNTANNVYAIDMVNSDFGYVAYSTDSIKRTNNAWASSAIDTPKVGTPSSISLFNSNYGFICGLNGRIYLYSGGHDWAASYISNSTPLNSIVMLNENFAYAVGNSGRILATTNRGSNWNLQSSGTTAHLNSVAFTNTQNGVAVGNGGVLLCTTNGGTTWQSKNSRTTNNLNSVYFATSTKVYAVGDNGVIIVSTDGGASWFRQISNISTNLHSVSFVSDVMGFAVGDNGVILKTTNGGDIVNTNVSVSSPNGGEILQNGATHAITWNQVGVDNVKISYTTNNGTSWTTIATVSANSAPYNWTVPNINADAVKIRIHDIVDSLTNDQSDNSFSIRNWTLAITSPNGGESLNVEQNVNITWSASNINEVDLHYSTDNGTTWTQIAGPLVASISTYAWTVPNILDNTSSNQVLIRIRDNANTNRNDNSNATFTIVGSQITNITSPVLGQSYYGLSALNITWTSLNVNNVNLEYTTNNGTTWNLIANNINASAGLYIWTLPNISSSVKIRVSQSSNDNVNKVSGAFAITAIPVIVTAPNGGEYLLKNSNYNITWVNFTLTRLDIDYSSDGGSIWTNIASDIDASLNTYSWNVNADAGPNYKIRIRNHSNSSEFDVSDASFSISSLQISTPTALQSIEAGATTNITWTASGITSLDFQYSLDNGLNWITFATNINSALQNLSWLTPNVNNGAVLVKAVSSSNSSLSATVQIALTPASITLLTPNGADFWQAGKSNQITWSSNFVDNVIIQLSTDNGANWISTLALNIPASQQSYTLSVPYNSNTANAKIRISDVDYPSINDESNAVFTITDDSIKVITPNGQEKLYPGTNRVIRWYSKNVSTVNISYSIDNGTNWIAIANAIANTGSYNWTVPQNPSRQALVKVTDASRLTINDQSDENFTITGLKISSPNGGEEIMMATNYNITWTGIDAELVNILYSTNNGTSWTSIVSAYPASAGNYSWAVPYTPSATALVKIQDQNNTAFIDQSDATFAISGLVLTSPVGNEKWLAGSKQNITWRANNVMNLKIEYTTGLNNDWITIMSDTLADSGSYTWDVAETPSKFAKVRITNIHDNSHKSTSPQYFEITGTGIIVNYPNGGEEFAPDSLINITWFSANVDKVYIEYSTNAGKSWTKIADSIDAKLQTYPWEVASASTKEYLIRIKDSQTHSIADESNNRFTVRSSAGFDPPSDWETVEFTGNYSNIIVPASITPLIGNTAIQNGDAIGIFYSIGTQKKCAGYAIWNGSNMAITVWGDNGLTSTKDGFDLNETYEIKIWDASEGVEHNTLVQYSSGNSYFYFDTYSVLSRLVTHRALSIPLPANQWSMISSNLIPENTLLSTITSEIEDNLEYMKNENGQIYFPRNGINNITNWNIYHGYQIYMNAADTLEIIGTPAAFTSDTFNLYSNRWHIMSYLAPTSMNVTYAFASLTANNRVNLVKNANGDIYYPAYSINQIGTMQPGQGYKISVNRDTTFVYPTPPSSIAPSLNKFPIAMIAGKEKPMKYAHSINPTGNSATLVIEGKDLNIVDELGIFTKTDILVGSAMVSEEGKAIVTIWGDNYATNSKIEGALHNEELQIKLYKSFESKEFNVNINSLADVLKGNKITGNPIYYEDALWLANVSKSTATNGGTDVETSVISNEVNVFPNPFVDNFSLKFSSKNADKLSIELFDLAGTKLNTLYENYPSLGEQNMNFDLSEYANGIYIIRITQGKEVKFTKVNKLK